MFSKSWRRVFLLSVVAALLLLPAVSQAEPRASHASRMNALDRIAEPAPWLNRLWEAVTGLWQAASAGTTSTGQGDPGDTPASDSGLSIDPDGGHGG